MGPGGKIGLLFGCWTLFGKFWLFNRKYSLGLLKASRGFQRAGPEHVQAPGDLQCDPAVALSLFFNGWLVSDPELP